MLMKKKKKKNDINLYTTIIRCFLIVSNGKHDIMVSISERRLKVLLLWEIDV